MTESIKLDMDALKQGFRHDKDEHWTKAGLPDLARVAEVVGRQVSRKELEDFAPDFKRVVPEADEPEFTDFEMAVMDARGESDDPDITPPSPAECGAFLSKMIGCQPVAILEALEHMSIGNSFNPHLRVVLETWQAQKKAAYEFRARLEERARQEKAAGKEGVKGLVRGRFNV